jgi:ATP-dependent RNA helicase SUPV3L1/SUV3
MPLGGGAHAASFNAHDRDFAFVALDEAQLGQDPERGHVFTDRMLRARGREETMILGAETLRPMLRALLPGIEIVTRPRFSTLSYVGPKKLSRLPKRSVVVAFSAHEVYAVAEMLRRQRGGAAVVMGALSPRTRNAQVAMYQAGEVDYLVATDAIGMGLNMDVAHVAFASLRKFDGRRNRRLTVPEMAQIAGRAGRHHRDGSFGTLGGEGAAFEPDEVAAIEGHHFSPLDHLYWRCGTPDYASPDRLVASLEARPDRPGLRGAPQAIDLAVLKRLVAEPDVSVRAEGARMTRRLWDACGLPDFRRTGAEHHARLVARIFGHLSEGDGRVPARWFADELARLDSVAGDVETLADRLAGVRTWAYIANRADWLADPHHWAARTREIEERLSDALHDRLTQRFVDRRTSVLLRDLSARGADALPVAIDEAGAVSVAGEAIGHLSGFRFVADAAARHADMKRLLAAAERRLGDELARRARALAEDDTDAFTLATDIGRPVAIFWRGDVVARLGRGRSLTQPRITLHRTLDPLGAPDRAAVAARLETWLAGEVARHLPALGPITAAAVDETTPPPLRAILAPLVQAGGVIAREAVASTLPTLDPATRKRLATLGVRIGTLDLFVPALLRPAAMLWRLALAAARTDAAMPPLPPPGAVVLDRPDPLLAGAAARAGFRTLGEQMLRVDLAERLARHAHDAREGRRPFAPDPSLSTSLGLRPPAVARLMRQLGFARMDGDEGTVAWAWRGRRDPGPPPIRTVPPGNAFGSLATLFPSQQRTHG